MFKFWKAQNIKNFLYIKRNKKLIKVKTDNIANFIFFDGDEFEYSIDVSPIITPDGCINFKDKNGRAHRLPKKWVNSRFKGFNLPEHLVLLTGAGLGKRVQCRQ